MQVMRLERLRRLCYTLAPSRLIADVLHSLNPMR